MTFNRNWFVRHQRALLVLLNLPIIGQVLRRAMWIPELWLPVTLITPDAVHVALGIRKRRAILYSNPQYAEGLHRSFSWLWSLVHAWDMQVANRWLPAANLGLDTYTSQPDSSTGLDTFMGQFGPTTNFSSDQSVYIGESNSVANADNILITKYDLTSIPSGAIATAAIFSLWNYQNIGGNASVVYVHKLLVPYNLAQVTWNQRQTGVNWNTGGGQGLGSDIESSPIATRSMSASETNGEKQWSNFDLYELSKYFGNTPDKTNYGEVYRVQTGVNNGYGYRSSRYSTSSERPKMVIEYVLASGWWYFF